MGLGNVKVELKVSSSNQILVSTQMSQGPSSQYSTYSSCISGLF